MENSTINNAEIFLVVFAGIFLILWITALVRQLLAKGRVRKRNAFIWKQKVEFDALKGRLREETAARTRAEESLEAARAANDALTGKPVAAGTVSAPSITPAQRLDEAMETSHSYLRTSFGKDDLAALIHADKKDLDAALGERNASDYIASYRMEYALMAMRSDPGKEDAAVAGESGFSGPEAMDKACRKFMGMSLEELHTAMKA